MATDNVNGNEEAVESELRRNLRHVRLERGDYQPPTFGRLPRFISMLETIVYPLELAVEERTPGAAAGDDFRYSIVSGLTEEERDQIAEDVADFRHSIVSGMQGVAGLLAHAETEDLEQADVHAIEAAARLMNQLAELSRYLGSHAERLAASKALTESEEETEHA